MRIETRSPRRDTIHVRVDAKERQRAEAAAVAAGVTLSELVRAGMHEATRSVLGQLVKDGEAVGAGR